MTHLPIEKIFDSLSSIRWDVAHRTYGNNHATLIGLLVEWWIYLCLERHTVLEAAPSHGKRMPGARPVGSAGAGDAIFCRDGEAAGVLEVENMKTREKIASIVKYFETDIEALKTIWFGVLLPYPRKGYDQESVIKEVKLATEKHPGRPIIVITIDKKKSDIRNGVRTLSSGGQGLWDITKITGILFRNGGEDNQLVFFDASTNAT